MENHKKLTPLAAMLTIAGSFLLISCNDNQAPKQAPVVGVSVVTLKSAPLDIKTDLPGRTSAYRIAEVRPQVGGIILKRNFTEGGDVTAGSSLYQIDPATYKAAYNNANGDLVRAQAAANIAHLTLERYRKLVGTKYISQQEFDDAQAQARQADATVVAAKASLENARINLAYTKVTSPISGRIGKSSVTEGALVTTNQANPLARVQQLDPIYVDVTQSSKDFLRLKDEMASGSMKQTDGKANVELIMENGQLYPQLGSLEFSDVTVDESTGSLTIRAIFPNPDNMLLPGMFVRARLNEGIKEDAILVPQQGVTRNQRGEATVLLVGADNKVEMHIVNAVQAIGNKWLVTDGVKNGDKVIVMGVQKLRVGAQVKPEEINLDESADKTSATGNNPPEMTHK